MSEKYLDFEQPIEELNQKIQALRMVADDGSINIADEIERLEAKSLELKQQIFSKLDAWQVVQMARHPKRPQTSDYISGLFTDFQEMHGDRHESNAPAIIAGLARFNQDPVVIIGHQKGKSTKEKLKRNFGMARPEEYRRALRLMQLAEKFNFPIITFIDTAGAYPGIGAEERNQSEAIARNLYEMSSIKTPIICIVTGEAGSGGALAIGVGDRVLMLEYSIYSVISPEGCASILWKDPLRANEAAEAMGVSAEQIFKHKLVDGIIKEPLGGAHRDPNVVIQDLKRTIESALLNLKAVPVEQLMASRYDKLMALGAC